MRFAWLGIWCFLIAANANAQSRIESEYKIAVPKEEVSNVWAFLESGFGNNELKILPQECATASATEVFYDTYFDDSAQSLLGRKAGARYRERYVDDSLVKKIIQLKVPTMDDLGVARREYKFSPEVQNDIKDRKGLHPFLKHIKTKDLAEVDLVLGQFGTAGRKMTEAVKLKQVRKRIYVSDAKGALMTFTLDEVSAFYFPYSSFVELELELNEIRYTDAEYADRLAMEEMNAKAKQALFDRFDHLVQDQTPKYNKMYEALAANPSALVYNNLMYLLLGAIGIFAIGLMLKNERKFANT